MKRHLLWLAVVVAIVGGAWLFVFGTETPCDAMRRAGREVAGKDGGDTAKLINQAMSERNEYSSIQCIGLTIHMKISGAGAFKVVDAQKR